MNNTKFKFLKKGEGKLASQYHGETIFAKKRKDKIIEEQKKREKEYEDNKLIYLKAN